MKLVKYVFTLSSIYLILTFQSCKPAQVVNVRSNFDEEKKKLSLTFDLIGNEKNKYDLDFLLSSKESEYILGLNEISPKQINIGPANNLTFTVKSQSPILNDNFFLVKMTPKRRKKELNEIEIATIKSDTNKTIQDQLINPRINFSASNKSFLYLGNSFLANYPAINYSNLLLGIGHIYTKMGYFVEIGSTLNTPTNSTIQNNNQRVISEYPSNNYYSFTNNIRVDRSFINVGTLIRIIPSVIGTIGLGYGKRKEFWEVEEIINSGSSYIRSTKYSEYVINSFNGPQIHIGALIDLNQANIKISANILPQMSQKLSPEPYIDSSISFGFNF
jgi:hypothetical protein